jgi:hypothetical protein
VDPGAPKLKTFAIVFTYLTDIPDVAIKKDEYIVIAGGIITLECTVTSFPEVDDVVWLRNTSGSTEQIKAEIIIKEKKITNILLNSLQLIRKY